MSKRTRRQRLPAPCERITIESLAHDSRGVAHRDGKAVFIDGALPGEEVGFEYLATHRKHDEGRVTAVHRPSPERVEPKCPYFGVCGGCSLQHMAAAAQIRSKQQVLLDNLQHIGKLSPAALLAPLTGPVWGYRTKARLGVRHVIKKGRVLVGFREQRSAFITDLEGCEVLHPSVGGRIGELAQLIDQLNARARIPQIEVAVAESATALVFRNLDPLEAADLDRLTEFAANTGIHVYLQPAGPDSVQLLWPDESTLIYRLPDQAIEIEFRPTDFTQVNPYINGQIAERVLELLDLADTQRVLDLFCGLGNFTLPVARRAGQVTGVEGDAGLVSRARENAHRNGIHNATFHTADLAERVTEAAWAGVAYDRVLLDPPRSGAAAVMDLLGNIRPERIVYVSCHPGSLARDADRLVNEFGYRLQAAGVMDMFPHTAHVESIALFESA
ncbi:MAG: 23S rRNA (uracil(1939)-C(5))-methyltransferase RlmD [Gammaproteobacteria bacterium]|nr:23S rRNA (uracil(1939)-C(5))-methyltransferase RlmD [Gammaproteobacteria bacterium]MDH3559523.1 23S rRNA (uracil(1939)-C(5))-methyltransferase RlmD [Gammaproteobacteria bacterium]